MTNKNNLRKCPAESQLELLCVGAGLSTAEILKLQLHLQQCAGCKKKHKNLDSFYRILIQEMQRPITQQVLDMAKQRAYPNVKYGLLLCEPIPDQDNHQGKAYRTKLLFSANGDAGKRRLSDIDLQKLPDNHLAIRYYTDPHIDALLLYLWNPEAPTREKWFLSLAGSEEKIAFNRAGTCKTALQALDILKNNIIYFNRTPECQLPLSPAEWLLD